VADGVLVNRYVMAFPIPAFSFRQRRSPLL